MWTSKKEKQSKERRKKERKEEEKDPRIITIIWNSPIETYVPMNKYI